MNIPDRQRCFHLLHEHGVPGHIKGHCVMVARVAVAIVRMLGMEHECEDGPASDPAVLHEGFAQASGMLHDIAKMECIRKFCNHADRGAEILSAYGLYEIADAVRQHVLLDMPATSYSYPDAAMILNYADKRVMHTRFVSLEARFDDLFKRYGTTEERKKQIDFMFGETRVIEDLIFSCAGASPQGLQPASWCG